MIVDRNSLPAGGMPGGPPAGRAPAGAGLCGDGCSPAAEHLDDAYGEEEPEADDVGGEAGIDERQPADEQEGAFPWEVEHRSQLCIPPAMPMTPMMAVMAAQMISGVSPMPRRAG